MRVQKIGFNTNQNSNLNFGMRPPFENVSLKDGSDRFESSEGKEAKPSFLKRVFSRVKPKTKKVLTPEEEKNRQVKNSIRALKGEIENLETLGSYHTMALSNYIIMGKINNFKDCTEGFRKSDRLHFENNGKNGAIGRILVTSDGKLKEEYIFPKGENEKFTVRDYSVEDSEIELVIENKKVLRCTEKNKKTGVIRELTATDTGFSYFEGVKDSKGKILKTQIRAEYKKDKKSKSYRYMEADKDGHLVEYKFSEDYKPRA